MTESKKSYEEFGKISVSKQERKVWKRKRVDKYLDLEAKCSKTKIRKAEDKIVENNLKERFNRNSLLDDIIKSSEEDLESDESCDEGIEKSESIESIHLSLSSEEGNSRRRQDITDRLFVHQKPKSDLLQNPSTDTERLGAIQESIVLLEEKLQKLHRIVDRITEKATLAENLQKKSKVVPTFTQKVTDIHNEDPSDKDGLTIITQPKTILDELPKDLVMKLKRCSIKDLKSFFNDAITAVFTTEILSQSSLTGKVSGAFKDREPKKKIDHGILNHIRDYAQYVFRSRNWTKEYSIKTLNAVVTTKCNNASKVKSDK